MTDEPQLHILSPGPRKQVCSSTVEAAGTADGVASAAGGSARSAAEVADAAGGAASAAGGMARAAGATADAAGAPARAAGAPARPDGETAARAAPPAALSDPPAAPARPPAARADPDSADGESSLTHGNRPTETSCSCMDSAARGPAAAETTRLRTDEDARRRLRGSQEEIRPKIHVIARKTHDDFLNRLPEGLQARSDLG